MKKITQFLVMTFALLFATLSYAQGVTTSSINGQIKDINGEPLPGATIVAIHLPTGSKYGVATDLDGNYRISNMKPGGPYQLTISYVGFADFQKNDLFLQLGQSKRFSQQLQETSEGLDEVVITAQRNNLFDGNKTGSETTIGQREIQTIASASRSIADFVRLTPQTQITDGDDGFSISISGQNNRFNSIYIDGAVSNDVFGLAGSGTNGGQTGVSPFSVDAIEQFQVNIAPFDVKISGFTGGAINAITRSGSNKWDGSAYYFLRNQDLAGKTPVDLVNDGDSREKLNDFTAETYGVRVGGPIIEDKLFFFANYERQKEETPLAFNISNYGGNATAEDLDRLRDFVRDTYNYDIGGYTNNARTLESDKFTTRLDFNASDSHKLTAKFSYVSADNLEGRDNDFNDLGFENGAEQFTSKTYSGSLEWNYQGNKVSNRLLLGYTSVRDDRDPSGDPFPAVQIGDSFNPFGFDGIQFGAETFSTANLLDSDIFTITNDFEIYSGDHTFTIGTHNEFASLKNLFFRHNYGRYLYNSIDEFINESGAFYFEHGYSLLNDGAGDESSGAAEFNTKQFGFYLQDEWQMSNDFKLTYGIRFDAPIWEDGLLNDDFNNNAIPVLEAAGKDLQGARAGQGVSTTIHASPRIGFNWDVNGESKTQIRGGLGIFTSRLPFVWPGSTYNNNGVTAGLDEVFGSNVFNPDALNQPHLVEPGTGGVGGQVDLFASDFKLPQVIKYNLAVDQKLPWGITASADFVYNDNINAIYYENLNIGGPIGALSGADDRPIYNRNAIVSDYERIILASNTGGGNSWNTSLTLTKNFLSHDKFKAYTSASYSYGDANVIFDGTSSQNSSQWRGIQTVNGKNSNLPVTTSDFSQGHRVLANSSFEYTWNENLKTTIGLFYDGTQGQPFSYIYGGNRLLNDDSRDEALIFVPATAADINLVDIVDNGVVTATAAEQWTALNAFIEGNDYLRGRRGQYADRNGDRGLWSHVIDLKFIQDFSLNLGGKKHTLQLTADIFNFTNLLNKDWGKRYFVANSVQAIEIVSPNGSLTPEFQFDPDSSVRIDQIDDSGVQSSRWQMQFGVRYSF